MQLMHGNWMRYGKKFRVHHTAGDSSSAGVIANPLRILGDHYSSSSDSTIKTEFEQLIPRHSLHDAPHFNPARLQEHFPPHLALHWHRIIFMRLSGAGARSVIIGVNLLPSRLRRCRETRVVRGSLKFFSHTPSNSRVITCIHGNHPATLVGVFFKEAYPGVGEASRRGDVSGVQVKEVSGNSSCTWKPEVFFLPYPIQLPCITCIHGNHPATLVGDFSRRRNQGSAKTPAEAMSLVSGVGKRRSGEEPTFARKAYQESLILVPVILHPIPMCCI